MKPERLAICCAMGATAFLVAAAPARAQERIDAAFQPTIAQPEYRLGQGPLVLVDRAHHNFHAGEEQFGQLARLLQADGYRVPGLQERFSAAALAGADVLVIVNAIAGREDGEWHLPTTSAVTGRSKCTRGGRFKVYHPSGIAKVAEPLPRSQAVSPLSFLSC
jgi:hypothetical protein